MASQEYADYIEGRYGLDRTPLEYSVTYRVSTGGSHKGWPVESFKAMVAQMQSLIRNGCIITGYRYRAEDGKWRETKTGMQVINRLHKRARILYNDGTAVE